MARKKIKFSVKPAQLVKPATEDEWQTRDDADKIKRYAELKGDNKRYNKALDHVTNEHRQMADILSKERLFNYNADNGSVQPRSLARAGRKKSVRVKRSSGRR